MKLIKNPAELTKALREARAQNKTIGFVPTMGALHRGHLSLVELARKYADLVVVSIFVNPTQFAPNEDYDKYPRDLEGDLRKLANYEVEYVFAPDVSDMYDAEEEFWVICDSYLTQTLEGASRPTHFRGVTTIVAKLFNIVEPDIAVFGKKDYQQALIIKKMVRSLRYPIKIVTGEIVREDDGIAMSSRNQYLDAEQRRVAQNLYKTLTTIKRQIEQGLTDANMLIKEHTERLNSIKGFKVDYIAICDRETLKPVDKVIRGKCVILMAAYVGTVRLIDNMEV